MRQPCGWEVVQIPTEIITGPSGNIWAADGSAGEVSSEGQRVISSFPLYRVFLELEDPFVH